MSTKKRKESAEQEPIQPPFEDSEESEEVDSEDSVDFGDVGEENEDDDENAFVPQSDDSEEDDEVDDKLLDEVQKPAGPTFYDDSSEEEWDDLEKNRVGKIPMQFYEEYDHIGYNLEGKKVAKPQGKDEVDKLLAKVDDPNYWRTVKDVVGQRDVVLDKEEYELIKSLVSGKYPLGYNPYETFEETPYEDSAHPLVSFPTRKDDFRPLSKWDRIKIRKLVHAIKQGWIKMGDEKETKEEKNRFYDIWNEQSEQTKKMPEYLSAPKIPLPTHSASYNPPPEYLLNDQEKRKLLSKDFEDRRMDYIPQKYRALRSIPAYENLQQERFYRCLDLYLAPRVKGKVQKVENAEQLLPQLRDPETLRPFPSVQSTIYEGHSGKVRSISIDPTGQWLLSGSDDNTVRIFEIQTGRCQKVIKTEGIVYNVAWNPDSQKSIIAVAAGETVLIIDSLLGNEAQKQANQEFLSKGIEDTESACVWVKMSGEQGIHYSIKHEKPVKQLNWHAKGDYLIAVSPDAAPRNSIIVHQLSLRKSQCPFKKQKGQVQFASFHPTKPILFVATQLYIKKYNLAQMKLEQKLITGSKWISCFDVHPGGDHLVMGGYDKKVSWFDLDLSTKPYKVLKYHKYAIRRVAFHKRYPLFASCSDDLSIHIFHGMVFNDLLQNPYIQPLKVLKGHKQVDQLGVLDIQFHPTQPWIFSAGSDSTIRLFT